jgi:hypothetical protein
MPVPVKHKGHSKKPSYAANSLDKEIPLANNEVSDKKKHHHHHHRLKCQIM